MSKIEVNLKNIQDNPSCPHGPTVLFTRIESSGESRKFFACAACRDRKDCNFFLYEDEKYKFGTIKQAVWGQERKKYVGDVNHRKMFLTFNEVQQLSPAERAYCHSCSSFELPKFWNKHLTHDLVKNITDHQLSHPTEFLKPLDNAKKEAQFLFSKVAVETTVEILRNLNFKNIICIGTPRIFEYISNNCNDMNSILLDIDKRYHSFFGPLNFCWFNSFNNHFFLNDAKDVYEDFLKTNRGKNFVLVTDPPFGGRIELLAETFKKTEKLYKSLNNLKGHLPMLWFFPYFMEPQILNSMPDFQMLDYKVDYQNHPLFQDGPKGRKHGSPVRIFTNINPSSITLPEDQGYIHCKLCNKWVSKENMHCIECNNCTSKDGRVYKHCNICKRCVKPTWKHCETCHRCAQPDHTCREIPFTQKCFNCKQEGHKKGACPNINRNNTTLKRKKKSCAKLKLSKKKCK